MHTSEMVNSRIRESITADSRLAILFLRRAFMATGQFKSSLLLDERIAVLVPD
jgi:hypothetical protein